MGTVAVLMENGIPVSTNPKIRTPDDVVREGLAELGGMIGGKVVGGLMKMKQGFQSTSEEQTQKTTLSSIETQTQAHITT